MHWEILIQSDRSEVDITGNAELTKSSYFCTMKVRKSEGFMRKLWYDKPAKVWEEALPLGNGRMGAMVFGGILKEQIQVNEESIWDGRKKNRINKEAKKMLPEIRRLIFAGEIEEAERLMKWSMSGCPQSMPSYQTLGEMTLNFWGYQEENVTDYRRELDLENAICRVNFCADGVAYQREAFLSYPDDVMVVKLSASKKRTIHFDVVLGRGKNTFDGCVSMNENTICLYGSLGEGGFQYAMSVAAKSPDGKVMTIGDHLICRDASEVLLYFSADCTFHYDREKQNSFLQEFVQKGQQKWQGLAGRLQEKLSDKMQQSYLQLYERHVKDYQELFHRVELVLSGEGEKSKLPTDVRLQQVTSEDDMGLLPLYFDYGRYLMISCSRPGTMPANLQGIWNKDLKPSWESKYTININTEMNYWLAETANLSECHMPLFWLLRRMVKSGEQVAKEMYGCRGFVAHHNTDIHGDCMVQDRWIPGSYWVMGAAWLCTHVWQHYLYTKDERFLEEHFPIMRKAAEFFLDFLVEKDGYMVTVPSVSPENRFVLPNGEVGANIYGVTMDNQLLRDLFSQCLKAAAVLEVEDSLNDRIAAMLEKIMPDRIAEDGYLMEWPLDYEEQDKGHRHISHLYGLHPSEQITVDGTPALAKAAEVTLERRLSNGGGHTGWSRAWIINHYAKLWQGDKAYENLILLLHKSTYPNLFDCHPPFQIDGNFGAAAGIIEMVIQSSEERIVLLPALPAKWQKGSLKGVRVKGGAVADVYWENGELKKVIWRTQIACECNLLYKGMRGKLVIKPGQEGETVIEDDRIVTMIIK